MLYNLYNVLPKASRVVATEYNGNILIIVGCPYGYKLFKLSDDILGQALFKRVDDLFDLTTQTLVYDNTFRVVSVVGSALQIDELGPELNIMSSQRVSIDIPLKEGQKLNVCASFGEIIV